MTPIAVFKIKLRHTESNTTAHTAKRLSHVTNK